MISANEVKQSFAKITGADIKELDDKNAVFEQAVNYVQGIIGNYSEDDENRVMFLAVARANYYLALIGDDSGAVSSFKAGDVSFTKQSKSRLENAKKLYESALYDCRDIAPGSGFAFKAV